MPRKPTRAKQLGIDDAEYERLLAAQGGHCALCPNRPKTRRLHVDHDHATGKVRGLLCYVCNKYLPASRDAEWHRRAAEYIEAHEPFIPAHAYGSGPKRTLSDFNFGKHK